MASKSSSRLFSLAQIAASPPGLFTNRGINACASVRANAGPTTLLNL